MEEYIIRARCVRSGFPSSGGIPNLGALQAPTKSALRDLEEWQKNRLTRYSERSFHNWRGEDEHVNGKSLYC
jgi:hypothetical protein